MKVKDKVKITGWASKMPRDYIGQEGIIMDFCLGSFATVEIITEDKKKQKPCFIIHLRHIELCN